MSAAVPPSTTAAVLPPVPPVPSTGNPQILITGGAGYIGSHTILCLLEAGFDVTVVDNLVNANEESLKRVQVGCPLLLTVGGCLVHLSS